ncbi:hypothetical protein [Vibrio sp. MA40-2]|uniref:hypothetical protein n=1 Tax=Vibrio sp. MA40-2 TaxID=3391828 RepID=UPI0039A7729C
MRILGVMFTVFLTLSTSILLDASTKLNSGSVLVVICVVVLINALKFVIWGKLNQYYDLSKTYPLTTLFYPLIFIYAIVFRGVDFELIKLFALIIIMSGIFMTEIKK